MAGGPHGKQVHPGTEACGAPKPAERKRRLIRGGGLVTRISNDCEPQLTVVGEDIPGPAVPNYLGTARSSETVDRRATVVGRGLRLPCSDSDDSDDDVLSVGPLQPVVTAAPLGGAQGHDDEVLQIKPLNEWSVDSWTVDDSCGEGCAQLDNFNWFIHANNRVGGLPAPELRVDLPDSENDVYDVVPEPFLVQMETTAVESLCPPVVAQTRLKGGGDPVSPRRLGRGRDVLTEDSPAVVDSRRESIVQDTDVVGGIYVMPDCIPTVVPKSAAVLHAASTIAQTRPRGGCGSNLLLPVDRSIELLDNDAPDVLISGREPAERVSDVGSDVCTVPNQLPVVVSVQTVVADEVMEKFVLVPEVCPVVSMTSTVVRTFGLVLSEEYSPVVLAGGGAVAAAYPLAVVESDTAQVSVLPMVESDTARVPVLPFAGCGQSGRWPAVSPIGFGGNPAGFARRARRDEFYSSGRNPGWLTCGGGASSGTDRAFGSGKVPGRWSARVDACTGTVRAFGSGDYMDRWTYRGDASSGAVRAFGYRKVLAR